MAFAEAVEIAVELGGELLEVLFFFDDGDLDGAASDFLFDVFARKEDDGIGNQRYFFASLALEL